MPEDLSTAPVGTLTLPLAVLRRHALHPGDTVRPAELDVFVRAEVEPSVTELALKIEGMRRDAGLSTEELLDALYQERERHAASA